MLRRFLNRFTLPIVSGLLIGTSYIPFPPWAIFFCLIPIWIFTLKSTSPKEAFIGAWLTQFILNLIGFHWIAYTAVEFGHMPEWAGLLVLLGFASTAHLYYPISSALWVYLNRRFQFKPIAGVFLLVTLFAIIEWIYPVLFAWHLGYPWLWAKLPGVQVADVIGFEGLNILTLLINGILLLAWQNRQNHALVIKRVALVITLFAIVNIVGLVRFNSWKPTADTPKLKFLVVQGNIGNFEKLMVEKGRNFQTDIVNRFIKLSKEGLAQSPDADILMWPETAFPDYLDRTYNAPESAQLVTSFLASVKKPLITGGYARDQRKHETYNGFFLLDDEGKVAAPPYHKTILLAFGEYFPGAEYVPWLVKLFPDISAFGRGSGPMSMNWREMRLGPQICYEGLFPWFSRGLSQQGAEIFVNATNDSWFGSYFEPYQHLYMTFARALEFRRPLVRATNTGITTAILADGEILQKSPLHQEWVGTFEIPYRRDPPHTFYEILEPLWIWILIGAALALGFFGRKSKLA